MRILIIVLLGTLMSLTNCATKRKTKEVEQVKVEAKTELKNDSVLKIVSKTSKLEANQTFNEFENVLKALNVQYDGEQGNELNVTLNRTENGTELKVSGKGKANYNEQSEKIKSLTRNDVATIFDSIIDARVDQYKQESFEQLEESFKSETDKKKTDISIWIYVVIGSVLVVGTAIYVAIKQLKGGK